MIAWCMYVLAVRRFFFHLFIHETPRPLQIVHRLAHTLTYMLLAYARTQAILHTHAHHTQDYTVYVLAMRCFLHPFIYENIKAAPPRVRMRSRSMVSRVGGYGRRGGIITAGTVAAHISSVDHWIAKEKAVCMSERCLVFNRSWRSSPWTLSRSERLCACVRTRGSVVGQHAV